MPRIPTLSIWIGITVALSIGGLLLSLSSDSSSFDSFATVASEIFTLPTDNNVASSAPPDAFLEDQALYIVNEKPPVSRVQCLSENFQSSAWLYRSCKFNNLCFDLDSRTFVLHPSEHQQHLESHLQHYNHTFLSSYPKEMISGGQHNYWLNQGRSKWTPESRSRENATTSYYKLSDDTVWISFYPWGDCNAGHLLWDSFLPIYTLLDMFRLTDKKLFLTEMPSRKGSCRPLMRQYGPMMGMRGLPPITTKLKVANAQASLVCTRHSASGMGWLTDHGMNLHGVRPSDFENPHNIFRSSNLIGFRNYLLKNIGMKTPSVLEKPHRVTFSILSSKDLDRRFDFSRQVQAVRTAVPDVEVQSIAMWNYTIDKQIEIATKSAVYISVGGGGTSPAFFLPEGASLILYGRVGERFDWDLWNNYAQVRTHWLTLSQNMENDTELLVDLVRAELEAIESLA